MPPAPTPEAKARCLECGNDTLAVSAGRSGPDRCGRCGRVLGSTPIETAAALDAISRLGGRRQLHGPVRRPAHTQET